MSSLSFEEQARRKVDDAADSPISQSSRISRVAWPKLDPLPEVAQSKPAPFPFGSLGPILGPAAKAIHRDVQVPDAVAAGSVLAASSLAAQPHADIVLPHGQRAPLSLFIATGAYSGERKSAADQIVQCEVEEIRREQARKYLAERAAASGEKDAPKVIARSLTIGKATVEGLQMILAHQPHVGLFSAEGGEMLGGHSLRVDFPWERVLGHSVPRGEAQDVAEVGVPFFVQIPFSVIWSIESVIKSTFGRLKVG